MVAPPVGLVVRLGLVGALAATAAIPEPARLGTSQLYLGPGPSPHRPGDGTMDLSGSPVQSSPVEDFIARHAEQQDEMSRLFNTLPKSADIVMGAIASASLRF